VQRVRSLLEYAFRAYRLAKAKRFCSRLIRGAGTSTSPTCQLKEAPLAEGFKLCPPATETDILALEERYGIKLSPILREYFLTLNGTGEGNFGEEGFAFFSLQEFKPVSEALAPTDPQNIVYEDRHAYPGCFVFSDYLLWCWGYAVKVTADGADGAVFIVTASSVPGRQVAESFTEFVLQYLKDSRALM